MAAKRRGLGTGLSVLIPNSNSATPAPSPKLNRQKTVNSKTEPKVNTDKISNRTQTKSVSNQVAGTKNDSFFEPITPVIKEELKTAGNSEFAYLLVSSIDPNDNNPRKSFDDQALFELSSSIKELGVITPIRVRKHPVKSSKYEYQLIAGERRLRAAKLAKLEVVPAYIADVKDETVLVEALVENIQRVDLNPLEEASAYKMLIDDYNLTQEQLSKRIGKSRPQITNMLRLLKAPTSVQNKIAAGVLSSGHARALLSLENKEQQEKIAARVVQEGLSVRAVEEEVALINQKILGLSEGKVIKVIKTSKNVAAFQEIAQNFADRLETVVDIKLKKGDRGTVLIEFADLDDLRRIQEALN